MVDEHEELPEEDPTEWESTEEEEEVGEFADVKEEFEGDEEIEEDEQEYIIKYDDGQESFNSDNDDFEGINEVKYDSVEGGDGAIDLGGDSAVFGGIGSEGLDIEFKGLPGESKLKNPFKYFKEKR